MFKQGRTILWSEVVKYALLVLMTVIIIFPFIWIVILSFKSNNEILTQPLNMPQVWRWENYRAAIEKIPILLYAKNTLIVATVTVLVELLLHTMCAFAITRMKFKTQKVQAFLYRFFLSGLLIPVFILLFPIYRITTLLHLTDTYVSLILPYVSGAVSFNILLLAGSLRSFPEALEEAAIIDGCNLMGVIFRITIPTIRPALATLVIFNFLGIWNEFPMASILINKGGLKTLSLAASLFKDEYSVDYAGMAAGMMILIIPQLVFYAVFQKNIISGMMAGAVKA